jgi:hypothetical protein
VGTVMGLLCLALPLDWCISVLLEHVSHCVPGPTESEVSVPVKVSRVKPDFDMTECLQSTYFSLWASFRLFSTYKFKKKRSYYVT